MLLLFNLLSYSTMYMSVIPRYDQLAVALQSGRTVTGVQLLEYNISATARSVLRDATYHKHVAR